MRKMEKERLSDLISRKEAIEAVEFFAVDPGNGYNDIVNEHNRVLEYVSDKIMHISPTQRWVPIDKDWPDSGELPDRYEDVLVSINNDVYMAHRTGRTGDCWFVEGAGTFDLEDIDAWMLKPKPYKRKV